MQHERADRDADACKGVLHDRKVRELLDKCGDDRNDNERRRDNTGGGRNAAERALCLIADECCGVYCDDTRGTLTDGVVVHQLVLSRPAAVFDDFALQNGQHGVAAAECAAADARKGEEQIEVRIQIIQSFRQEITSIVYTRYRKMNRIILLRE